MKEEELRENINCGLCNQPFAAAGVPIFHRVTIETYGLDGNAIKRQDGLAAIVGSSVIASVMGPHITPQRNAKGYTLNVSPRNATPRLNYPAVQPAAQRRG